MARSVAEHIAAATSGTATAHLAAKLSNVYRTCGTAIIARSWGGSPPTCCSVVSAGVKETMPVGGGPGPCSEAQVSALLVINAPWTALPVAGECKRTASQWVVAPIDEEWEWSHRVIVWRFVSEEVDAADERT